MSRNDRKSASPATALISRIRSIAEDARSPVSAGTALSMISAILGFRTSNTMLATARKTGHLTSNRTPEPIENLIPDAALPELTPEAIITFSETDGIALYRDPWTNTRITAPLSPRPTTGITPDGHTVIFLPPTTTTRLLHTDPSMHDMTIIDSDAGQFLFVTNQNETAEDQAKTFMFDNTPDANEMKDDPDFDIYSEYSKVVGAFISDYTAKNRFQLQKALQDPKTPAIIQHPKVTIHDLPEDTRYIPADITIIGVHGQTDIDIATTTLDIASLLLSNITLLNAVGEDDNSPLEYALDGQIIWENMPWPTFRAFWPDEEDVLAFLSPLLAASGRPPRTTITAVTQDDLDAIHKYAGRSLINEIHAAWNLRLSAIRNNYQDSANRLSAEIS